MKLVALFQIVIPFLLLGSLAVTRKPSRLHWFLNVFAFGMVVAYMWVSARWDISSIYLRTVLPVLFLVAASIGFWRIRVPEKKPAKIAVVVGVVINLALIVIMSGFNWFSFRGYAAVEGTVDLYSPLRDEQAVIANGGASPFTNGHFRHKAQSYALDLLGLTRMGTSADFFGDRSDLNSYAIFGASIYSPCEGVVTSARDDFEDLNPPATDREHPAGNHVLIECMGIEVLLAHMKHESLKVQIGDSVTVDSQLGQVGNTGNTSEPHVHIHAEDGGEPGVFLDGRSVPITINGRFLVRGSVISGSHQ